MDVLKVLLSRSNIEWCEARVARYAHSGSISELENTFSSFVYLPVAGYLMLRHRQHRMPFWFFYTEIVLCIVGMGSAIFHGTETYLGELLDEVPMTFLALGYLMQREGCLSWTEKDSPTWKTLRLGAFSIAVLGWIFYLITRDFEVFKLSFVLLVLMASALLVLAKPPSSGRGYLLGALAFGLLARGVWEQERTYFHAETCPTDAGDLRYHFHAFWHISTAVSHLCAQWYSQLQLLNDRQGKKSP